MPRKRPQLNIDFDVIKNVTFRDIAVLQHFLSDQNKILPRRKTGLSAKAQRHIAREIKRGRELGILGYRSHTSSQALLRRAQSTTGKSKTPAK